MESIVDIFYKKIIPESLEGCVDCELPIRIIFNVYFKENSRFLKATDKYSEVIVPTLIINNFTTFNMLLQEYVEIMLVFYKDVHFTNIDPNYYIPYIISTAIANMSANDYLNPELYFKRRITAIKNNPFELASTKQDFGFSEDFNCNMQYIIDKEKPNEECPFKYTLFLEKDGDIYEFQTIRFCVVDDIAYIGAIQRCGLRGASAFEKKINRLLYKANENITPENELYNANPSAVVALTSFIALLNKQGIYKVSLSEYGLQRWNDKKILYHDLEKKLLTSQPSEQTRVKISQIISKTEDYFQKKEHIRKQLINTLLRFNYHFISTTLEYNGQSPIICSKNIEQANNSLLLNVYQHSYSYDTKKLI